ncbi:hypothetical protein [Brevundimonas sp.]|jgi:hypothetical protein|uniref:hypothetical protein n=1 Tax=Brevundimonas sp. TaxID=1871086 RepID=UPI002E0D1234|nr:hypothetical protein [Brevundimonas sp.]
MLAALVSMALLAAVQQDPPPQDPPATRVDDIVVDGRPLRVVAEEFVDNVGEAPRDRGLARWRRPICVGAVNLTTEAARPLLDHIASVADGLGVRSGEPGCRPNVIIVFTEDPRAVAAAILEADPRGFRLGHRNFHLDSGHLGDFVDGDRAIRWWHTSVPTDSETGRRAVRLPGDLDPATGLPAAPMIYSTSASRLFTQIRDDLSRVFIVVDVDGIGDVTPQQLADYLAFVTLAQIDPRGDVSRQASVLNVFDDPGSGAGFSDWDMAYLRALYRPDVETRTNSRAVSDDVADAVARTIRSSAQP